MTSLERTMAVINGKLPDRVPTDLHNFMMASRMAGIPLSECLKSGNLMAESQLVAWRYFGHDMLLVENGTSVMAEAMGCELSWNDHSSPQIVKPALKSIGDIDSLRLPDPERDGLLPEVLYAVSILRDEIGDGVFIMGRADQAPMALAAAVRGYERFMMDIVEYPEAVESLLDKCLEAITRYALALQRAGAHGTSIGEIGCETISPATYQRFALPRLKKFFAAMKAANFPAALHQCGNAAAVLSDMTETGADILELDPKTDIYTAKAASRGKVTVLGMVDPANVLHRGTPELVDEKSHEALEVMAPGGGFILGPGCALVADTPEDNVTALVECARTHGVYRQDSTLSAVC